MTDYVTYLNVLEEARNEYARGDSFLIEVFDRAIRQVRAEAWNEAVKSAHLVDTPNRFYISHGENPYL